MKIFNRAGMAAATAALLATTACTTNPETGNRRLSKTAIGAATGR